VDTLSGHFCPPPSRSRATLFHDIAQRLFSNVMDRTAVLISQAASREGSSQMRRGHELLCRCNRCIGRAMGEFIDELGGQTQLGQWNVFTTISYRTRSYPWCKRFPVSGTGRPNPEFAIHVFDFFIGHVETQLGKKLEYVVVDQYGKQNGRFHQLRL
jgi:hypothetical protein